MIKQIQRKALQKAVGHNVLKIQGLFSDNEKPKTRENSNIPKTELTEQMATCDALFSQGGLHSRNGRGENIRLLKNLRSVRSIQRAEHGAVVQLHSFIEFNYRELVPTGLGAPVFILQSVRGKRKQ